VPSAHSTGGPGRRCWPIWRRIRVSCAGTARNRCTRIRISTRTTGAGTWSMSRGFSTPAAIGNEGRAERSGRPIPWGHRMSTPRAFLARLARPTCPRAGESHSHADVNGPCRDRTYDLGIKRSARRVPLSTSLSANPCNRRGSATGRHAWITAEYRRGLLTFCLALWRQVGKQDAQSRQHLVREKHQYRCRASRRANHATARETRARILRREGREVVAAFRAFAATAREPPEGRWPEPLPR